MCQADGSGERGAWPTRQPPLLHEVTPSQVYATGFLPIWLRGWFFDKNPEPLDDSVEGVHLLQFLRGHTGQASILQAISQKRYSQRLDVSKIS